MSSTEEIVAQAINQDAPAESSTANENQAEPSTFDLVKGALETQEGSPSSEEVGKVETEVEQTSEASEEKPEGDKPLELSEEEKKIYSPKAQERFQKLAGQVKEADARIAELAPKAEGFEKLSAYVRDNNIPAEDIDTAFDLLAKIRNNPVEGYKALVPIVQSLAQQVGAILPDDLQTKVAQGFMPEADARELAMARAQNAIASRQLQERDEVARQQQAAQTIQRNVDVASSWRNSKAQNDPDWSSKEQRVADLVKLRVLEMGSFPKTEKETLAMCEEALTRVEAELKPFLANRRPIAAPVQSSSSPRSVPEPKSTLDVVKNVLSGMG